MSQTSRARRFGLLGRTLGHSYSPQIHERLGSVPYDLVELPDVHALVLTSAWTSGSRA